MDPAYADTFVQPLLDDPLLGRCQHETLARLLPHLDERELVAGETLYAAGDATGSAWLILAGSVRLHFADGQSQLIESGIVGEEAGTELAGRQAAAVAESALRLLEIPLASLNVLIKANPELRTRCYQLLLSRSRHETQLLERAGRKEADAGSWRELIGWALTVIGPALILWFGPSWGLRDNAVLFLAMFCATVVMWVFTLVDEYVPSLFALLAILVLGLAPPNLVLAGFASDTFFLAMSVLGLGTVIVASGLSYRFLLWMLLRVPNHPFWQNAALMLTGILLTPVVPSINGRVALVAPLMGDMAETLRLPKKHPDTTRLAITAFTGASLLSAVFVTSKSVNFVIFSLLQPQIQAQFSWLHWTMAAGVAGGVMLLSHFLASAIFLGSREDRHLSRPQLAAQLHLLGRIKGREWAAMFGILIFTLGVATAAMHKVPPPWVALTILYTLLLFGFLRKNEFKEKIDWPFLVYLGGLAAITAGFNAVGLNIWLAKQLGGFGGLLQGNFELFLLTLFGVIFAIRLIVPISATIVIAAAVFMPLADAYGVNSWVVGMAVLILGEMWFFPYQCSYYMQYRSLALKQPGYDEKTFLLYNALMNLVKLGALYASLPYWKWLGLL